LFHKPRGCKGIWKKIEIGSPLRVTKGKGKWLKLETRSQYEIHVSDVSVGLRELGQDDLELPHDSREEYFKVEVSKDFKEGQTWVVETELKLERVAKQLQFRVQVKTPYGVFEGFSIIFEAHNNGKTRYRHCPT
jgi:hypothetical protein